MIKHQKIISILLVIAFSLSCTLIPVGAIDLSEASLEASVSRETYETFVCIISDNGTLYPPPSAEVYVNLTGNYEVDIAENVITKVSQYSPVVSIQGFGNITSGSVTYTTSNVRRQASHTDTTATFTATFDINMTVGAYDTSVYCGTYTISIVGGVDGGRAISCTPADYYVYPN